MYYSPCGTYPRHVSPKRYGAYRLTGMLHTTYTVMPHTVLAVNGEMILG